MLASLDFEDTTLIAGGASLAASRLALTLQIRFTSTTQRRCKDPLNLG